MMSTVLVRANAIFGFFTSTMAVLTIGCILTTYFIIPNSKVEIDSAKINLLVNLKYVHNDI